MKRFVYALMIALALFMAVPAATYAAPRGYTEVTLNKKNFKKYFALKKMRRDAEDTYGNIGFFFTSKLLAKGYYVYYATGPIVNFNYTLQYKPMFGKKRTVKRRTAIKSLDTWYAAGDTYSAARMSITKYNKVKGQIIFINPDNVVRVSQRGHRNGLIEYRIYLNYPYNDYTDRDYNGYYVTRYANESIGELLY